MSSKTLNFLICICLIGSVHSQTTVDFCLVDGVNPCLYSGVCTSGNTTFTCECVDGFVGDMCQTQFCDCPDNFVCVNSTENSVGFDCILPSTGLSTNNTSTGSVTGSSTTSTDSVTDSSTTNTGSVTDSSTTSTESLTNSSITNTGSSIVSVINSTGSDTDTSTTSTGSVTDSSNTSTGSVTDSNTTSTGSVTDSSTTSTGSVTDSSTTSTGSVTDSSIMNTGSIIDSGTNSTDSVTDTSTTSAGSVSGSVTDSNTTDSISGSISTAPSISSVSASTDSTIATGTSSNITSTGLGSGSNITSTSSTAEIVSGPDMSSNNGTDTDSSKNSNPGSSTASNITSTNSSTGAIATSSIVSNTTNVSSSTGTSSKDTPSICATERDPCENGSTCTISIPGTDAYSCACERGWIGTNCEFKSTFSEFPSAFILNINIGDLPSSNNKLSSSFLKYFTHFNLSDEIVKLNQADSRIDHFNDGVGAIRPPTIRMNTTAISIQLNDTSEKSAYFLSIISEKSIIIPIDVNGGLIEDLEILTVGDIPTSQIIFSPRELFVFNDSSQYFSTPLCLTEKGCDGFAFYPGILNQLYPQSNLSGFIFDLYLMLQTTIPTTDDFIEAAANTRDYYGMSPDGTKAYSHIQLFISSEWYPNSTSGASTNPKSNALSGGAIAGIVLGIIIVIAIILLFYYFKKCKKKSSGSGSRFRRAPGIAISSFV